MESNLENYYSIMSDLYFNRFRDMIYGHCGIYLSKAKKIMLSARLRKRLRQLKIDSFEQYYDYVCSAKEGPDEMIHLLNVVSTNKTEFFRESKHFDFMTEELLPEMVRSGAWRQGKRLNIWSAGCSSGEEPYTIAMILMEFMSRNNTGDFSILATDISTNVLEKGIKGIYSDLVLESIPTMLRRRYLMKGNGPRKGFCRFVPELRNRIRFQRLNLNNGKNFGIRTKMDIIFCRNVIIYFNRETQKKLFENFFSQILPGGYLFIGHSETLHGINDQFKAMGIATYRRPGDLPGNELQKNKSVYSR